ncbi:hypothetical protein [Sphingomonas sp. PR090111-T3T-6A]|uniref:hypothetical protein n=1 Tax=Sphingomonas sp. PR090111-T3T-6A TaxID=685778 RepID=UPI00036C0B78|nr:hypothetical protein [Sphingomonas sp. PR090111-T3T-6A]
MSLFDTLMGKAGNIDLGALAQQVGLNEDELRNGGESLLSKLASGEHDADSATAAASSETGISADKLQALLPALSSAFGGEGEGGLSGIGAKLSGLLDRDGDGNPLNDLTGFAKGLFGKS